MGGMLLLSLVFSRQPWSRYEMWVLSDTFNLETTLLVASSNKHKFPVMQIILYQTDIRVVTMLFPCLCNGWVEWAGAQSGILCLCYFGERLFQLHPLLTASPPPQWLRYQLILLSCNTHRIPITGNASLLTPLTLISLKDITLFHQNGGVKIRRNHVQWDCKKYCHHCIVLAFHRNNC